MDYDSREENLPKWAQALITRGRRELADITAERDAALGSLPESNTYVVNYGGTSRGLGKYETIRFTEGDPESYREDYIDVRLDVNGGVRVSTSGQIIVEPTASNCFTVRAAKQ